MSRSHQQTDELFLPAAAHPRRESFFDYPSSPTYLYDEESGTFKTVWPGPTIQSQAKEPIQETYWDDIRPPSPLRTPPRNQVYQPPVNYQHQEPKVHGYFDDELYFDKPVNSQRQTDSRSQQQITAAVPQAANAYRRTDHEIDRALPPPNRARTNPYDKPVDDYNDFERGVDADGVSEASFSDQSPKEGPKDDRMHLSSTREPVPAPAPETSKAKLWATPRRDVAAEAPIVVHPEPSEAEYYRSQEWSYQEDAQSSQNRPRLFSDPGGGYERAPVVPERAQPNMIYQRPPDPRADDGRAAQSSMRYQRPPDLRQQYQQQQRPEQQRQRVFSDPGTGQDRAIQQHQRQPEQHQHRPRLFSDPGAGSHWERRRDMAIGRSSMPPIGAFNDDPNSSFKVLNVQRVPVGSLDQQITRPSREDAKKPSMWKKLKGYVS